MDKPLPETDGEETTEDDAPDALPPRQELALQALLTCPTQREAALAAGVSEATLWRYMKDEEFSRRLSEARGQAVGHAAVRLQGAVGDAVAVLSALMTTDGTPPATRVTAARTVLDYAFRVVEMDDLKARVADLEQFIIRKQEEDAIDRGRKVGKGEEDDED